jgi:hypothetical protein
MNEPTIIPLAAPAPALMSAVEEAESGSSLRPLPARIGPVEFGEFGRLVAVRCPHELDHLMRKAGGEWEPGSRRWPIERRRIGPVIRALQCTTDPLLRHAGLNLDRD